MKINIVNMKTGEVVGVATTRYNNVGALFNNVMNWMRRHKNYSYVSVEELESNGLRWSSNVYYVKEN